MKTISLREEMLKCALGSMKDISEFFGDNLKKIFLFGSVAKGKVHENSDIDILCIGTEDKSINLLNRLSEFIYSCNYPYEVNIKYYEIKRFKELYKQSNLFLNNIKYDLLRMEDINELL